MDVGELEKPAWFDDVDARDVIHVLRSIVVTRADVKEPAGQRPS
jgi:hypothetical protein